MNLADLASGTRKRLPITNWMRNEANAAELLVSVRVTTTWPSDALLFANKVTLREQNSAALIGCALFCSSTKVRLFFSTASNSNGEMPLTAAKMPRRHTASNTRQLLQSVYDEYEPSNELIASRQYQRQAAVGLFLKFLLLRRGGTVESIVGTGQRHQVRIRPPQTS